MINPKHQLKLIRVFEPKVKFTLRILFNDNSYSDIKNTYLFEVNEDNLKVKYYYKSIEKDNIDAIEAYYDLKDIKKIECEVS